MDTICNHEGDATGRHRLDDADAKLLASFRLRLLIDPKAGRMPADCGARQAVPYNGRRCIDVELNR